MSVEEFPTLVHQPFGLYQVRISLTQVRSYLGKLSLEIVEEIVVSGHMTELHGATPDADATIRVIAAAGKETNVHKETAVCDCGKFISQPLAQAVPKAGLSRGHNSLPLDDH